MSNIIPFSFEKHQIRVVTIDGDPWFVGKDVCYALGYKDATKAMKLHCRWGVKYHPMGDSLGRLQDTRILAEPDVARMIIRSTLPAAEAFEKLVFETILPYIRKTGAFLQDDSMLKCLPSALVTQLDEIIESAVQELVSETLRTELPLLILRELEKQQSTVCRGMTAGQLWKEYNLPSKLKNASRWFGYRLADLNCQIDEGNGSQSSGIQSKLFDPDKVAKSMKVDGLLAYCRQYAQQRMGHAPLIQMPA